MNPPTTSAVGSMGFGQPSAPTKVSPKGVSAVDAMGFSSAPSAKGTTTKSAVPTGAVDAMGFDAAPVIAKTATSPKTGDTNSINTAPTPSIMDSPYMQWTKDLASDFSTSVSSFAEGAKEGWQRTPAPPKSFKNFGLPAIAKGGDQYEKTILDAAEKMHTAYSRITDKHSTLLEQGVGVTQAALGVAEEFFAPLSAATTALSVIPGVGYAADAVNNLFSAIGGGFSKNWGAALDKIPMSDATREEVRPSVEQIGGLFGQFLTGKAGSEVLAPITEGSVKILQKIARGINETPQPKGAINPGFVINSAKDLIDHQSRVATYSGDLGERLTKVEGERRADEQDQIQYAKRLPALSKGDKAAVAHYAEDKNFPATDEQKAYYERWVKPFTENNAKAISEIQEREIPLSAEDHLSRQVVGKGGLWDKIQSQAERVALGGKSFSRTAGALMRRTYQAATDEEGNRFVVSTKGGTVTRFEEGKKTPMGNLHMETNEDIAMRKVAPLKIRADNIQREMKILESVKTRESVSPTIMAGLEDRAYTMMADLNDTATSIDRTLSPSEKSRLETIKAQMRVLSKVRPSEDIVLRKERLTTLAKKLVEAVNQMADIENRYMHEPRVRSFEERNLVTDPETGKTSWRGTGKRYTLSEATMLEIEKNTSTRYHKDPAITELITYHRLRAVKRNIEFVDREKESPEFQYNPETKTGVAVKANSGIDIPSGWKETTLPQFRNYYFEPRVAEMFDDFHGLMGKDPFLALDALSGFVRDVIVFNPIYHWFNLATFAYKHVGAVGAIDPRGYVPAARHFYRALKNVATISEEYKEFMRAGGPSLSASSRGSLVGLLQESLANELEADKPFALKAAKAIGTSPARLVSGARYFSRNATWAVSDILHHMLMYSEMDRNPGMTIAEANRKVVAGGFPDGRLPTRIFPGKGGRALKGLLSNHFFAFFSSYHYSQYKSTVAPFIDVIRPGLTLSQRAKAIDQIGALALMTYLIFPTLDHLLQKATGNPNTKVTRFGVTGPPEHINDLRKGTINLGQYLETLITPNPVWYRPMQIALNNNFYTNQQISTPETWAKDDFNFILQGIGASQIKPTLGETLLNGLGVTEPVNTKEAQKFAHSAFNDGPALQTKIKELYAQGNYIDALNIMAQYQERLLKEGEDASGFSREQLMSDKNFTSFLLKPPSQKVMDNYISGKGQPLINKMLLK